MPKNYKPTIAIDFDGVIASLGADGYFQPSLANCQLIDGSAAAIQVLVDTGYHIVIHTSRAINPKLRADIMEWLDNYDVPYHDVTNLKPPALMYIDDRAIRFDNWTQTMAEIGKFNIVEALHG